MLVPSVPVELLQRASEIACRRDRRQDPINVLLNERSEDDFPQIFAAVKRMHALSAALRGPGLERWIITRIANGYSELSPALWLAAATAELVEETDDSEPPYSVTLGFRIEDLQRSAILKPGSECLPCRLLN
jgi:hypothetical protein